MASLSQPNAGQRLVLPTGVEVASYSTYVEAQRAVDFLSDENFPVSNISIVGTDLRMVEKVLGRLTYGRVAMSGALNGAWFGLLIGLLFMFMAPNQAGILLAGPLMGAAFGILAGVVGFALRSRDRDFTSTSQVVASRYAIIAEPEVAGRARRELEQAGLGGRAPVGKQPAKPSATGAGQSAPPASAGAPVASQSLFPELPGPVPPQGGMPSAGAQPGQFPPAPPAGQFPPAPPAGQFPPAPPAGQFPPATQPGDSFDWGKQPELRGYPPRRTPQTAPTQGAPEPFGAPGQEAHTQAASPQGVAGQGAPVAAAPSPAAPVRRRPVLAGAEVAQEKQETEQEPPTQHVPVQPPRETEATQHIPVQETQHIPVQEAPEAEATQVIRAQPTLPHPPAPDQPTGSQQAPGQPSWQQPGSQQPEPPQPESAKEPPRYGIRLEPGQSIEDFIRHPEDPDAEPSPGEGQPGASEAPTQQ